jgi:hypothetical protein
LLRILPVCADTVSETDGMTRKCRKHNRNDRLSGSLEYQCRIPLASVPEIRRDMIFAANHCTITYDFDLSGPFELKQIEIDPLLLPGKWRRYAVVEFPAAGYEVSAPQWQELTDSSNVLFDSGKPFLIALFENHNGQILEVGTGDDLWRWYGNSNIENADSNFNITVTAEGIAIRRTPLRLPVKTECGKRCRRFKWYFAWNGSTSAALDAVTPLTMTIPLPDSAMSGDGNGGFCPDTPCFQAAATEKRWKKIIRSNANSSATYDIAGIQPHLCAVAAHLERGSKKTLRHWDMMALMDFYLWANQHLANHGGKMVITPPAGSPLSSLPSLLGMTRPPALLPESEYDIIKK